MSHRNPTLPTTYPSVPDPAAGGPRPVAAPPPARAEPARPSSPGPDRRPGLTPVTLFLTLLVAYVAIEIQLVLILLLMALVLATAIERPVQLLERRHVPRPVGILAVYAAIVGSVTLLFVLATPVVGDEASRLREEMPGRLEALSEQWAASANPLLAGPGQDLIGQAANIIAEPEQIDVPQVPGGAAVDVVTGVVGGVVGLLTVFVIAFYYLMEKRWLRRLVLDEITAEHQARVGRVWDNVEAKVGDWLRGQLLLCLVIGSLATVGYGVLGVPFWPLLGLWAGLTEIIPVVGPWLGGIPAVIVALTQSWNTTLLVIGFIVALQMLENTILVPRVMRGAVGLTPLTVFIAILAGTQFRGIVGALLAIPVAAAVQVVLTDYLDARRASQSGNGSPLSGWRWMRGQAPTPPATPPSPPPPPAPAVDADGSAEETAAPSPPTDGEPPVSRSLGTPVGRWAEVLTRAAKRRDPE